MSSDVGCVHCGEPITNNDTDWVHVWNGQSRCTGLFATPPQISSETVFWHEVAPVSPDDFTNGPVVTPRESESGGT